MMAGVSMAVTTVQMMIFFFSFVHYSVDGGKTLPALAHATGKAR
jgi:hypothetical protein